MDLAALIARQRQHFASGVTRPQAWRRAQLRQLRTAITRREAALLEALHADLRKPPQEAYTAEIGYVLGEIDHALRHLATWTAPSRRRLPLLAWPGRATVQTEPYGVALILGPWNYPFQLLFSPLVGALAAGNCAVLKPSEFAPRTSAVIAQLVADTFPTEMLAVVEGDHGVATDLLRQRFDTIFFTGSTTVGQAVMAAAAPHLTPVTLELGGKCPAIVCADAAVEVAARRLAWGKFLNAGQTCVAPDFVAVDRRVRGALVDALHKTVQEFYGKDPRQSADYARIVNRRHFDRLTTLAPDAASDAADLYIAPTIVNEIGWDHPLMQEEIFGPILPVLEFDNLDEVTTPLRERPTPLALYLFTNDSARQERLTAAIRSGGVCINDTVIHLAGKDLPFGGLGASGMGTYHGRASFDCFSHPRAVVSRPTAFDLRFRYPPPKLSLARLKKLWPWLMR